MNRAVFLLIVILLQINISFSQVPPPPPTAPTIIAEGDQNYCPLSEINVVTFFDIEDPNFPDDISIQIQISEGYNIGSDLLSLTGNHPDIIATWNVTEGRLNLVGTGAIEDLYTDLIAAVNDVVYQSSSININTEKHFSISYGDANYLPLTGHYYQYIPSSGISWTEARDLAATMTYYGLQGYLATLLYPEEAQLTGDQAAGTGWIGGSDAETEGVWKWVTGPETGTTFWNGDGNGSTPPGGYANWNTITNEPNNAGDEDYAHITDCGNCIPGSWNDLPEAGGSGEYFPQGFIVEYGWPGDPPLQNTTSTKIRIPEIINPINGDSCGSGSVILEAEASIGTVLWFDAPTLGNQVGSGSSFTTPILNSTTLFYALASENGCTEGIRTSVVATIKTIPIITSSIGEIVCIGESATLTATASQGIVNWYGTAIGGPALGTGTSIITPALNITTIFYAEAEFNGCVSTRIPVIGTVQQVPSPTGNPVQTFCANESAEIGDIQIVEVDINWYDDAIGGNLLNIQDVLTSGLYYAAQVVNGCESNIRLAVEVIVYQPIPYPFSDPHSGPLIPNLIACDSDMDGDDSNGEEAFDLTQYEYIALDNLPPLDYVFTYFTDDLYSNQITNPSNFSNAISGGQRIYVRSAHMLDTTCYTDYDFEIIVNPLPVILSNFIYKNCDEDGVPDGFADYNLEEVNDLISDGNANTFTFSYHLNYNEAESNLNGVNPIPFNNATSNTVFVRVENEFGCHRVSTVELQVSTTSFSPGYLQMLEICDDDDLIDGKHIFDLTQASAQFLSEFPTGQNLSVHYFKTLADAQLEQNEILDQTTYINEIPFSETLFVRVESDDNGECFGIGPHLVLTVHPRPEFEVDNSSIFCLYGNPIVLETYNPSGIFTYQWFNYLGDIVSDQSTASVNSGGMYTVIATSINGCESFPYIFEVVESGIASLSQGDISVVDFSSNNTVAINNSNNNLGIGDYEFSLDEINGPYQDEPYFSNVGAGTHILYVRDKNGCGIAQIDVFVLGFPKYFTPNNDGYHDTWNISGWNDSFASSSIIYIYDRYGKLVKQLSPWSNGWTGDFNGNRLPTSDYWFTMQLIKHDGSTQVKQGHFSLVR